MWEDPIVAEVQIVYGQEAGRFGLALPGTVRDVFIGYYGSFLDTYRGM